jgi:hypothetical protein
LQHRLVLLLLLHLHHLHHRHERWLVLGLRRDGRGRLLHHHDRLLRWRAGGCCCRRCRCRRRCSCRRFAADLLAALPGGGAQVGALDPPARAEELAVDADGAR